MIIVVSNLYVQIHLKCCTSQSYCRVFAYVGQMVNLKLSNAPGKGCLSIQIWMRMSGPGDLFGFRSISFFHTISGVMSAVDNVSPGKSSDSSRILSNLSVVNTLQKNSFSESAFSFGVVAFAPSDFSRVGIFCLVFNLDFAYLQNNFGFWITFLAIFCSKSLLNILVTIPVNCIVQSKCDVNVREVIQCVIIYFYFFTSFKL